MVERVRPLKMETLAGGGELDMFPTSLDPQEDLVDSHGLVVQSTTSADEQVTITRDASDNLVMVDPVSGTVRLSDIKYSAPSTGHLEIVRSNGKVTGVVLWTTPEKTQKIKETAITRTEGVVSSVVETCYKADGTSDFQVTYSLTRSNGSISSIAVSRS